jgi:hypothetical protein
MPVLPCLHFRAATTPGTQQYGLCTVVGRDGSKVQQLMSQSELMQMYLWMNNA